MRTARAAPWILLVAATSAGAATEDMDFVAEHLPEAAMDNRLLSLPLSYADNLPVDEWSAQLQALASRIESGNLRLSGAGAGFGLRRQFGRSWAALGIAFFDRLPFSGDTERRPVAPIFSESFPVSLPADATLSNQRGDVTQWGIGVGMRYQPEGRPYSITFGALRERVKLDGYRVDYRLTSGPSAGTAGTLDYSSNYPYWTPFATFEWRITRAAWQFSPRFSAGVPIPTWGWRGRITGPGFDVAGDTEKIGRGRHMGDSFGGFGFGITYSPWHLTVDAGALLNQMLLEQRIHEGVNRAWLLNFSWEP
jgi:hypothetical protein